MARSTRISVDLEAGTSKFTSDLEKATAKIREFGHSGVTEMQALSGGLRTVDGNIAQNIRSAERFLATLPGVGAAFKAAFPVIGLVAVGGLFFELTKRVLEAKQAFDKFNEKPANLQQGFQELNATIETSNDQLRVGNDRLANEIAKLEGKPQNSLKLALDEASLAADNLAKRLQNDLKEASRLLKENELGGIAGFFTNQQSTDESTKQFRQYQIELSDIIHKGTEEVRAATSEKAKAAAQSALNAAVTQKEREELDLVNKRLAENQRLQAASVQAAKDVAGTFSNSPYGQIANRTAPGLNRSQAIITDQGLRSVLQNSLDTPDLEQQKADYEKRLADLRANAEKKKPSDYFGDAITKLQDEISAKKAELAAGDNPVLKALAEGAARARAEVTKLNKEFAETGKAPLNSQQSFRIFSLATTLADLQAEGDLKKKVEEEKRADEKKTFEQQMRQADELLGALQKQAEEEDKNQSSIAAKIAKFNAEVQGLNSKIAAAGGSTAAIRQAELDATAAKISAEKTEPGDLPISERIRQAQELLQLGYQYQDAISGKNLTATQGFRQYFQDLANNTQSAGNQVKSVLGGAFQGLDRQITDLITGQKTNFSSFFRSIAADIANAGLNTLFAQISKGVLTAGTSSGGIGGILSAIFGGFKAEGGPLDSGKWYIAGEHGPEPVWGGGSGAFATGYGRMMTSGGGNTYIDARGSENSAAVEARINRAIAQARQDGARDGAKASREARRRVPNSRSFAT